ncbi:MAG: hypothetical protein AAF961_09885, partial [Planctomycetota bacterium]
MEKNPANYLPASIVIGVSLIICSYLLSSGLRDYGKSVERAAVRPPNISIPNAVTLRFESGGSPVRIQQLD